MTQTSITLEPETEGATRSRVAVVTGGARGIGEQVVRRLAGSVGIRTLIGDVNEAEAQQLATELTAGGADVAALPLDVSSEASVGAFFAKVDAFYGRCDILVNNAGIARLSAFDQLPIDIWNATLAVNLTGPLLMTRAALPLMRRNGWGRIVNLASVSGFRAGVGRTAYGTSKTAIMGLTRQMAIELATDGITVNAVAPGPVTTEMAAEAHSAKTRESYNRLVPMGRYATPEEVASAITFLCSDDASYITGHTIPVDGGYLAAGVLEA